MAFEIFKLFGSIYVDNSAANSEFDKTSQKAEETASKFGDVSTKAEKIGKVTGTVGKGLTTYVTAPLAAIGTAAISSFNAVDDGMDVVIKATGATGQSAKELETVYRNVSSSVSGSFTEIGGAVGEVSTRFGFTGEQLQSTSEDFMKFSRVTGVDATEGVRLVSRAMGDANIPASEYNSLLDELTVASQASGISVDTLTESLAKYGAPMRNLGFDTKESIAIFSQWEKAGVNTEVAFSGMKKAIGNWGKEGKDARTEFKKTLKDIQDAPDIASATSMAIETFGQKAGPDLADAIQNGRFSYEEFMQVLDSSDGTLQSTYEGLEDGGDKIKNAWKKVQLAGADLGNAILNVIAPAVEKLSVIAEKAGQWFSSLSPAMQRFIVILGMVAAAAGPALLVFTNILKKVSEFSGFFSAGGMLEGIGPKLIALSGPIAIVVASIAAISAILIGAWNNSEKFRNAVTGAFSQIQKTAQTVFKYISTALSPVKQSFTDLWNTLGPVLKQIGDMLAAYVVPILTSFIEFLIGSFGRIIAGMAPLFSAVANLLQFVVNIVGAIVALLNGDWNGAIEFAKQAMQSLWDACINVWNCIWGTISAVLQIIANLINTVWSGIVTTIQTFLNNIWNAISTAWTNLLTATSQLMINLWNAFSTGFTNLWLSVTGWAQNVLNNIWTVLSGLWQKGTDAVNQLSSGMSTSFGTLWSNVTSWAGTIVTNIWSAVSGLYQKGVDMITNFSDGIKSGFESLWTNITSWCGTVVDKFKEALGISSPSTVLKQIGVWATEGFFNGLGSADWGKFASNIMEKVVEAFKNGGATLTTLLSKLGSGITGILSSMGIDIGSLFGLGGGAVSGKGLLTWPSDSTSITSWFGYRDDVGSVGSSYHQGLDIGAAYGTPIYAAASGNVEIADWYGGYGNAVKLSNGGGLETLYGHMSSIAVSAGQQVAAGQVIGYVGSTGNSTGPHLHFSVLLNGEQVDPSQFFELAEGGIVTDHIVSHLGDGNEPEAVVPLSKAKDFGFGSGKDQSDDGDQPQIVVNITVNGQVDENELARKVINEIKKARLIPIG